MSCRRANRALRRLQIRQQEIAARRSVAKNPVKMDAIKREVALAKAQQVRACGACAHLTLSLAGAAR